MQAARAVWSLLAPLMGCTAVIGNIGQLRDKAAELNLPSVVVMFEPQPHEFFSGDKAPARLMRWRDKAQALFAAGIDHVVCLQFNASLQGYLRTSLLRKCWSKVGNPLF